MKKKIADQWVKALRSGKFKQTTGKLERIDGNCCLGVLCNIAMVEGICDYDNQFNGMIQFDNNPDLLPNSVQEWAGMKEDDGTIVYKGKSRSLAYLNDSLNLSFKEIANVIEKNWRKL